jgi:hypothetical protein
MFKAAVVAATVVSSVLAMGHMSPAGVARSAACPKKLVSLTLTNPIAPATTAALRATKQPGRPQVTSALLATADKHRGGQAKAACGTSVWERTVVVYITDRALLPSQSLSQRVFFVGRFKNGFRVWQVVR